MLSGYEFYKIYQSLHLHFTTESYDVLKYGGRTRTTFEAFKNRRDAIRFDSFANKLFNKTKAGQYCIANLSSGNDRFMYESYEDGYEVYLKWKKVKESITREFENDVKYLTRLAVSRGTIDLFDKTKSGNLPPILQVALGGDIHPETVLILNKEHKEFLSRWEVFVKDDPYLSKLILRWKKYQPFVSYDPDKIKPLLEGAPF